MIDLLDRAMVLGSASLYGDEHMSEILRFFYLVALIGLASADFVFAAELPKEGSIRLHFLLVRR